MHAVASFSRTARVKTHCVEAPNSCKTPSTKLCNSARTPLRRTERRGMGHLWRTASRAEQSPKAHARRAAMPRIATKGDEVATRPRPKFNLKPQTPDSPRLRLLSFVSRRVRRCLLVAIWGSLSYYMCHVYIFIYTHTYIYIYIYIYICISLSLYI